MKQRIETPTQRNYRHLHKAQAAGDTQEVSHYGGDNRLKFCDDEKADEGLLVHACTLTPREEETIRQQQSTAHSRTRLRFSWKVFI